MLICVDGRQATDDSAVVSPSSSGINAGATDIYRSWYLVAHPGGTVKIGEHVDADLKTEVDNLYVCDRSAMPEEWGLPPTLTLLGLGKRLANHLTGAECATAAQLVPIS